MGSRRRAGGAGARPSEPSRRAVLLGASATPVLASAGQASTASATADPTVAICAKWLAVGAEKERLLIAWGDHEDWLARTYDWHRLSSAERSAIPEGGRLGEIEALMDSLCDALEDLFQALPVTPATSVATVIANLTIAGTLTFPEDCPDVHGLIVRAVRDLEGLSRGA